jgi:hypothetical protein
LHWHVEGGHGVHRPDGINDAIRHFSQVDDEGDVLRNGIGQHRFDRILELFMDLYPWSSVCCFALRAWPDRLGFRGYKATAIPGYNSINSYHQYYKNIRYEGQATKSRQTRYTIQIIDLNRIW